MSNKIILALICLQMLFINNGLAQVRVQMENTGASYKVPCVVNGLRMKFILDTGASLVQLSMKEALFMLENDYITEDDILGTTNVQIADGSIAENTVINLREVEIGGVTVENVKATVTNNIDSPLLLGLSALTKLGNISIEGAELVIQDAAAEEFDDVDYDIQSRYARDYMSEGKYAAAADNLKKIYNAGFASGYDLLQLGICEYNIEDYEDALKYLLLAEKRISDINIELWSQLYYNISSCYMYGEESVTVDNKSLMYAEKALSYAKDNYWESEANHVLGDYYYFKGSYNDNRFDYIKAKEFYNNSLASKCKDMDIKLDEAEKYNGKNGTISYLLYKLVDCKYALKEISNTEYKQKIMQYSSLGNDYATNVLPYIE